MKNLLKILLFFIALNASAQSQGLKTQRPLGLPGVTTALNLGTEGVDRPGDNPSATSLLTGLVFYANLSSTSTQVSGLTFTNNNSVTFSTGKVGNASYHVRSSMQNLSVADADAVSLGDRDWTFQDWFRLDNISNIQTIVAKRENTTATTQEYGQVFNTISGGILQLNIWNSGTTLQQLNSAVNISAETWYHVVAWHDNTANKVYLQINNGTIAEATLTVVPYDGGNILRLGCQLSSMTICLDGRIDEFAIWQRVLTADERAYLYNGGAGRTYTGGVIAMTRYYDERTYSVATYEPYPMWKANIKSLIGYSVN